MKNYDVVALGIAVMDIVAAPVDKNLFEYNKTPVDSVILAPGGDAANQAAHLARLGWRTALCCRLGEDALSRMFTAELAAGGVDLSHAAVSPESVMTAAVVLVAADGQRSILHRRGNNYDFCREDVNLDVIAGARALTVGSIYGCPKLDEDGLEQILAHAKEHGVMTFADMATDKRGLKLAGIKPLLPYVDWFASGEAADGRHGLRGGCSVFLDMGATWSSSWARGARRRELRATWTRCIDAVDTLARATLRGADPQPAQRAGAEEADVRLRLRRI